MAWSRVQPAGYKDGRRAYDYSCTCGEEGERVSSPAQADQEREEHMRAEHRED